MKFLFLACFLALVGASLLTARFLPGAASGKPLIYWVTDQNPIRVRQVSLFQQWMNDRYPGVPVELQTDMANADPTKRVIESISGVGGDIMDTNGGGEVRYFQSMGTLMDVTDAARRLHFEPSKTYPVLEPEMCLPDAQGVEHQYTFPCNVTADLYFVNRATFRKYNMAPPPLRWTLEEFERIGKEFVAAANPDPNHRKVFFADAFPYWTIRRSLGVTTFNETGTRCVLDAPGGVETMRLQYQWTFVDHLYPTRDDRAAQATAAGYGGSMSQLFNSGNYAMMYTGRYMLIQFRKFDDERKMRGQPLLDMSVSEPPNGGFPNCGIFTRAAAVYQGGPHKDLACDFLQFLASKEYNMEIVADADGLPPNPQYVKIEAFLHPPDHPNEWDVHGPLAEVAQTIALGNSYSPFVLEAVSTREEWDAQDAMMLQSGGISPEAAARRVTDRINAEIQRTLVENPELKPQYDHLCEVQKEIDADRAAGRKITKALMGEIHDPFYRKYYRVKGWVQE